MRVARIPTCHPDRRHEAHGLCPSCYTSTYHPPTVEINKRRNATKAAKARKLKYYKANSEKLALTKRVARYGLTLDDFMNLLEKQSNRCKICLKVFQNLKTTHVDHDHTSGQVRGLLCPTCNAGLGMLKDSSFILGRTIAYLKQTNPDFDTTWQQTDFVDLR